MSTREHIVQELTHLSEAEIAQVAEFLAFLKFRSRIKSMPRHDEAQLAALYAEFANEDRELAEEGMADYADGLWKEDVQ